jgi:hypothetical protein
MKLRKDDGSELKKGEYEIDCGETTFILEANAEELKIFAEFEVKRIMPYMMQNISLMTENHSLRRRLEGLGIFEGKQLSLKDEPNDMPKVQIVHFDKTNPKEAIVSIKKDMQKVFGEDTIIYENPA